jgi:VanZ family protein
LLAIFLAVVALIVYGSLYPWVFRIPFGLGDPLGALLRSWLTAPGFDRRYLADVLINLALYMPIGMSGYLASSKLKRQAVRLTCLILFGFLLSATIEMLQLYVPGRRCSIIDVLNNTLGTAAGIIPAMLFEAIVGRKWMEGLQRRYVDRAALAILLLWLSSLLFPLFPVMWLGIFRARLHYMAHAPLFDAVAFVSALGSWYVVGLLLKKVVSTRFWLWASLSAIPLQFFIMYRVPSLPEFLGAISGAVIFTALGRKQVAWAFLGLLIFRGLSPFHFVAPHSSSLIPFEGFLAMNWQAGVRSLLEKSWYVAAAIWLLRLEKKPLNHAILIVMATTACIELAQVFLPGRTAEITDPLLALLMGLALRPLLRSQTATGYRAPVS